MLVNVRSATATFVISESQLREKFGYHPDQEIHDILLGRMKEQGFPYNSLKDNSVITQWFDVVTNKYHWHVVADWIEKGGE